MCRAGSRDVRFAHSPGRLDPAYVSSLVAFDAAFVLDLGDGTEGIVGLVSEYRDVNKPQPPKPARLPGTARSPKHPASSGRLRSTR